MKIAYISTYTPRLCGIATFTKDLLAAMEYNDNQQVLEQHVFAVSDSVNVYDYPMEVVFEIAQQRHADYVGAAKIMNSGGYDLCVLEHEYGIYGGNSGVYILSLLHKLTIPVVVNLHTVLDNPSADEREILKSIAAKADKLVVMSAYAVDILQEVYHIPLAKIVVIPHGVPHFPNDQQTAKALLGLADKKILLTFGFLGHSKGIDLVLRALPSVLAAAPDLVYLIVGKTHPSIVQQEGEVYRQQLENLVDELGIAAQVQFVDQFVDEEGLTNYLSACDAYITPYRNEAQMTSGTLAYAVGAGAAVVSTPYWHAKELLKDGRGLFVDFEDTKSIAATLQRLFTDAAYLKEVRQRVAHEKHRLSWKKLASNYRETFMQVRQDYLFSDDSLAAERYTMPPMDMQHIRRLTNQVGIVQHATYATPNYHHGYCLDDNARALILALMLGKEQWTTELDELVSTYISYIYYAQREDGLFKNFMSFDNRFLEEIGSEDAFGRAIWALGYLVASRSKESYKQIGKEMFMRAVPHFKTFRSLRAVAYVVLGLTHYLEEQPQNKELRAELQTLVSFMMAEYRSNSDTNWHWFEKIVSYDNAILPLAMFRAHRFLQDESLAEVALATAGFLDHILFRDGNLSLIGNEGWYQEAGIFAQFGQQPIEVYSTMLLYEAWYSFTDNTHYLDRIKTTYEWFLGNNDLHLSLYDAESGGCCDGLEAYGVNRNQGAESSITFWLASAHMQRALAAYPALQSSFNKSLRLTVA